MTIEQSEEMVKMSKKISDKLIENSIEQINKKYSEDYHKQNPHILSSFIELNKAVYLSLK